MPTLTYIYTIPRMDAEMQDVRTAIANKQKDNSGRYNIPMGFPHK